MYSVTWWDGKQWRVEQVNDLANKLRSLADSNVTSFAWAKLATSSSGAGCAGGTYAASYAGAVSR